MGKKNKATFMKNEMLQDACLRQLQEIGEACNVVSKAIQKGHPEIEWAQINGLRNIVIHEYFGVDAEIVWNIIKSDLPPFLKNIDVIIESLPD